ncbi:hypothetical protein MLD38_010098 [Melastoma candidum]|uniref:Uncharacterized protein n=1 Tax=Melastoma candidum TaxID=119954 RepID=A0ACB9QYW9_9MYRT|nr:hypothetical protein MLD38_010098 [Melastoma candidum]
MADTPPSATKLGVSILVPCVQELAKGRPSSVPPRYVRAEDGVSLMDPGDGNELQVPVIDFGKLMLGGDADATDSELRRLDVACREWGFFQLINHGVSASLIEDTKESIHQLFNLPMEEKLKYWQESGDIEGFGQAFVVSDEQKLDWGDMYYMVTLPKHLRNPRLFPKLPPPIKDALDEYSAELEKLAMKILTLMARTLEMDGEEMSKLFEGGMQGFRMNYYPPCPQPELVHGLTPHSDGVGLTILLQVNEMEGLQIRKDGNWVPISPIPGAFVINVGDILEIITNGIYRSIEHRAMTNPVKERLSIAAFYSPRLDGDMGPAPSLVTEDAPQRFKRLSMRDYFKGLFSRELDRKSYLASLRI